MTDRLHQLCRQSPFPKIPPPRCWGGSNDTPPHTQTHTVSHMDSQEGGGGALPRTWAPLYQAGLGLLHARPKPRPSTPSEATLSFWLAWNQRPMLRYLMKLSPEAPRQQPGVWQAWQRLLLPPADRQFIQTAPWKKLTVGVRLANWQAAGTACPICGLLETMQHALTACKYFSVVAHVASQCMGPATTDHGPETNPTIILWDQPELSLTTPLGITLWSVVRAAWSHRCMVKMNARVVRPSWDQFLTPWIKVLRGWEEHPTPTLPANEISLHTCPAVHEGPHSTPTTQGGGLQHTLPPKALCTRAQAGKKVRKCGGTCGAV